MQKRTNAFLFNRMFWSCFITLVIGAVINWSWVVTKYNANYVRQADWDYIYSLNYNKQILNDLQKPKTPNTILDRAKANANNEKSKPFLSKNLYYQFLKLEK